MGVKIIKPVVVNTDDLTLSELDRAAALTRDGVCGNVTAMAYVWLRRDTPGVKVEDVAQLHNRDVIITSDDETPETDPSDPTQ